MESFEELSSENSEDAHETFDFFRNYFDSYDIIEDDDDSIFGDDDDDNAETWSHTAGSEGIAGISGVSSGSSLHLVPVGDDSKSGARKKKRQYKRKIVKRPITVRPAVPRNRTDIRIEYSRMLANVMNQYTVHCLSGFLNKFAGDKFELRMECLLDQAPPGLKELPEPCNVSFTKISTAAAFWGLYVYQIPDNTLTIHSTNILENYRDAEGKKGYKVECEFTKSFTRVVYASPNDMAHVIAAVEVAQSLRRGSLPPGVGLPPSMPPMSVPFPGGIEAGQGLPPGMDMVSGPPSMMPPMNFPFPGGVDVGQGLPPMPPGMDQVGGPPPSMMPPMSFPFPGGVDVGQGLPPMPPGMDQAGGPPSMMPPINFPFPGGLPSLPPGLSALQSLLMSPPENVQNSSETAAPQPPPALLASMLSSSQSLPPPTMSNGPSPSTDDSQQTLTGNPIADEVISMIRNNMLPPPPRLPRPVRHVLKGKVLFHLNSKKAIEKLEFSAVPTSSKVL